MDNRELWARYDQLLTEYERTQKRLVGVRERLQALRVKAESKDGLVKVTVGPRGNLVGLELDAKATRRLSATELAETILETAKRANGKLSEQAREVYGSFLPDNVGYEQMLDGDVDLAAFMPDVSLLARDDIAGWLAQSPFSRNRK